MAEAAVENMSSRFFCHQCAQETNRLLEVSLCFLLFLFIRVNLIHINSILCNIKCVSLLRIIPVQGVTAGLLKNLDKMRMKIL